MNGFVVCPWCESVERLVIEEESGCFWIECEACICRGPEAYSPEEARKNWNDWSKIMYRCEKHQIAGDEQVCPKCTLETLKERWCTLEDLKERVQQYNSLRLPGQPMSVHMGTSYLINDLWKELNKEK